MTYTTGWREHAGLGRAVGRLGENVRGLLGWMNPVVSMIVNRSGPGIRSGGASHYGPTFADGDVYGDLLFSGRKA